MSRALYRKYRSRSLEEVVGQEHVTKVLGAAIEQGKTSHAYLLTGPRGVGKTSVARIMAHRLNQLEYSEQPHLDIIEIDAASNRRIDDIRDLRDKIHIAPTSARFKVYIIDEVHMLTGESFNALLKTLEEPPAHAVFILATTELHKLPATIVSRTQRFHFRPASLEAITAHLKMIAGREDIKVDDDALELIAGRGDGSFRDSISLLDQLASLSSHITAELVQTTLGLAPLKLIDDLMSALTERNHNQLIDQLESCEGQGINIVTLTDQLVDRLRRDGRQQPQLFKLIDRLLAVRQSHNPLMKLTAILVDWIRPTTSQPARSHVAPEATFMAAVKPVRTAKPAKAPVITPEPAVSAQSDQAVPTVDDNQPSTPSAGMSGELEWDKVMEVLKTRYAPLHSVVSRAKMDYQDGVLTMNFAYSLHRKKLENPTYRSQLLALIDHVCGFTPELRVTDGKPKIDDDPATAAVAAIMGGGEVVNA